MTMETSIYIPYIIIPYDSIYLNMINHILTREPHDFILHFGVRATKMMISGMPTIGRMTIHTTPTTPMVQAVAGRQETSVWKAANNYNNGWLMFEPPFWNIWFSQLGCWNSQYMGKWKMFRTTNQLNNLIYLNMFEHVCCNPDVSPPRTFLM